jgi:ATP-dependent helicase HrpB
MARHGRRPVRVLPIDPLLPAVTAALGRTPRLVLRAAPGAGKTTRVPTALLDAGLAGDREVVVLEPRRIAARAAAGWVARERGEAVGETIGYRVRFEQRGGRATRVWYVTEGVFSRQLASDPFLERAGVVVLDEFHERHLQGDVALAVVRSLQATVRADLRLVVMSATLDTDAVARALGDAEVLTAEGRVFPVRIEHDDAGAGKRLPERVASAVRRALAEPGDVLAFLPGAAEIRRTAEALASADGVDVLPLHGDQPLEEQERALRPGPRRRVVLATNVAETALTVEGVTAVVDSGLARVARFDARHGVNVLRVQPISRASADQRAGRAGRTAPGRCIRLWSRAEDVGRRDVETPEVLRLDLSRTALELRAWALGELRTLPWLDPPPEAALARAETLLVQLGAVDADGALTETGRRMLALPAEPRLARLLVEAERAGAPDDGALVAALASERDVLAGERTFGAGGARRDWPTGPSDLLLRMELFSDAARRGLHASACRALGLEPRAVGAVERARRQFARLLARERHGGPRAAGDAATLGRIVLAGFPDRVARRRAPGAPRAVMVGGTGVVLAPESVVRDAELFVALDLDRRGGAEAQVRVASAVDPTWLDDLCPDAVRTVRDVVFDPDRGRVITRVRRTYHDLVLVETVRSDVDRLEAGAVLAEVVHRDPRALGLVDEATEALLARIGFLARAMPELDWPAAEALLADAAADLAAGAVGLAEVRGRDLGAALRARLSHRQRDALAREAPAEYRLPSGRVVPVRYPADRPPVVAGRIQELFGLATTPRLGGGRVPLVVELLAPNGRPAQVTDDLASFWRTTYASVRKELRGRYPKHDWPEDPTTAVPRARPGRPR